MLPVPKESIFNLIQQIVIVLWYRIASIGQELAL